MAINYSLENYTKKNIFFSFLKSKLVRYKYKTKIVKIINNEKYKN